MQPTIRIFGVFVLAIALASGVLYAIDHSLNANSRKDAQSTIKAADTAPLTANPASPAPTTAPLTTTLTASNSPAMAPSIPANRPAQEEAGAIAKCSIGGKIVYTDKGCPQGSKAKSMQIIDNAVIPGVDQATIERTLRQAPPVAQTAPPAAVIEPPVTSITTAADIDCQALGRRLEWLDYMIHRRQRPSIRDRMQRERDGLQTRRFWAHC